MEHSMEERKRHETEDAPASRRFPTDSAEVSPHPLLHLQKRTGNQAVQELLKSGVVQARLAIGQHDASEEQEAERMAEQVIRAPEPHSADVQERLQIKAAGAGSASRVRASVPPVINEVLHSPGQPLDPSLRAAFEPRFGRDFSHVRVHTGSEAAASARSINALAYTAGSDIVFGAGQFSPQSPQGQHLLAHELAHVVQQSRSGASAPAIQRQEQTESQSQSQGGGVQVAVNTNCNETDARAIALSIARAQAMVNAALDWFRNASPENDLLVNALLRARFGSDSAGTRSAVDRRLATVSAILVEASKANVFLNCTGPSDAVCSKNEYYAYVRQGEGYRINFCRDFFKMNPEEQVWGIIHETCHLAGALGDTYIFFYDVNTSACYGDSTVAGSPLDNADSYVSFLWCLVKPGSTIREGINIHK
jgi:hypothetical protein